MIANLSLLKLVVSSIKLKSGIISVALASRALGQDQRC
jgi:hypothetical protein